MVICARTFFGLSASPWSRHYSSDQMKQKNQRKISVQIHPVGYAAVLLILTLLPLGTSRLLAQSSASSNPTSVQNQGDQLQASDCSGASVGSPYIPLDSWIYQAVSRLYAMGYAKDVYLGLRPWTRVSVLHMLEETRAEIRDADDFGDSTIGEAKDLYSALSREFNSDLDGSCPSTQAQFTLESSYTLLRGMSGTPLRDSYHLGSTIINDFGRPYAHGFNDYSGLSGYASAGRFVLYARGEFQNTSSTSGYSSALTQQLAASDNTTYAFNPACWGAESATNPSCIQLPLREQPTIPFGPIAANARGRLLEAYISAQYLNHVISFGKHDFWQSPAVGGAMSYSNNAENIYAFRINRIEPLYVPLLSPLTGPFRYEFMIGPLKGHTYPIDPWVHVEKVSFRPTRNLEVGFERTVIWGGKGHEPINLKSFLRSFFSLSAPQGPVKNSPQDPGARFGAFDFSYRVPLLRNWVTVYSDSEVHDDVSPIDAPRRASWRPGIYLSHVPALSKLDLRVEAVSTDPPIPESNGGHFMYYEGIQRQGYTNNGQMFGDWIGREAKGGQAWATYHLSGNEWIQASFRNQKAEKDFIAGGTTLNDVSFQAVKRIHHDFEINGVFTYERYKAPIYLSGQQSVTSTSIQLTWWPNRRFVF